MKKDEGKKFEQDFQKSIQPLQVLIRLKDAGGWGRAENTRFTVKNVCDFIFFDGIEKIPYLLELKSTKGKSLPISRFTQFETMLITLNNQTWVQGRLIVNFRDINETYSIDIKLLESFIKETTSKSLPLSLFKERGILINSQKKRVRFSYIIEKL